MSVKLFHYICIKEDITERKNLQSQLQHAQKMEAIGRFAGDIAHDLINMMTVVIGFSDYLISQLKDEDSTRSIISSFIIIDLTPLHFLFPDDFLCFYPVFL